MRASRRTKRRRDFATYVIVWPSGMQLDHPKNFLTAASGTLQHQGYSPDVAPILVFEIIGSSSGIQHRFRVPVDKAHPVISDFRSQVPGVNAELTTDQLPLDWTEAREVGIRGTSKPLHIPDPEALSASILSSLQGLDTDVLIIQWVVTTGRIIEMPTARQVLFGNEPKKTKAEEAREAEPQFQVILRIAAQASSDTRARYLLAMVRDKYRSTQAKGVEFYLIRKGRDVGDQVTAGSAPRRFAGWLSVSELAAVIAWPLGSPHIAGLPAGRTRNLAAPRSIPTTGRILAMSNFPGNERPIALDYADTPKHLHVLGPIGTGKTTALVNYAVQDIAAGQGLTLIDQKGDLFERVLDRIPRSRALDVIVVDVKADATAGYAVAFNVMDQGDVRLAIESIYSLFEHLYPDMRRGVRARAAFHRGLHALSTRPHPNLIDLVPLFSNISRTQPESAWRDEVIAGVTDYEGRNFWQRFENMRPGEQDMWTAPILDRLWQLTERSEIKHVIGQSQSSFTMGQVLRERKILLVNLAGLGRETASIAGTLVINALWDAARSCGAAPDWRHSLLLDEFADFVQLPVSLEELLVKSRSLGISMILAHQDLQQLPLDMRGAILANARSKIVFQATADDARVMAREFGLLVSDSDFLNLGQYEVLARVATSAGVSSPITGVTLPPPKTTGIAGRIRHRSRAAYARPLAQVQQDIEQRRTARNPGNPGSSGSAGSPPPRRPRPTIGGGSLSP